MRTNLISNIEYDISGKYAVVTDPDYVAISVRFILPRGLSADKNFHNVTVNVIEILVSL